MSESELSKLQRDAEACRALVDHKIRNNIPFAYKAEYWFVWAKDRMTQACEARERGAHEEAAAHEIHARAYSRAGDALVTAPQVKDFTANAIKFALKGSTPS